QVVLAGHLLLALQGAFVTAQVEGQAHAAQPGDAARPCQVVLLAAAPAVRGEHARYLVLRLQDGAGDPFPFALNLHCPAIGQDRSPSRTWSAGGPPGPRPGRTAPPPAAAAAARRRSQPIRPATVADRD